jgi:hypothetical protein
MTDKSQENPKKGWLSRFLAWIAKGAEKESKKGMLCKG